MGKPNIGWIFIRLVWYIIETIQEMIRSLLLKSVLYEKYLLSRDVNFDQTCMAETVGRAQKLIAGQ